LIKLLDLVGGIEANDTTQLDAASRLDEDDLFFAGD
jgi:hypothetical protein